MVATERIAASAQIDPTHAPGGINATLSNSGLLGLRVRPNIILISSAVLQGS